MTPFYFGCRNRQLFGVHHPPGRYPSLSHGVLLCPPVGQEYMRTYLALRQLAVQLASLGFDVLKFDYHGVGDSSGASQEGDPEIWLEDILTALAELKDISGAVYFSIVGLRLGASLAAQAMEKGPIVENLLLWDPVINGMVYIEELRELSVKIIGEVPVSSGIEWLVGFPYTALAISRITAIDLIRTPPIKVRKNIFIVLSEERAECGHFIQQLHTVGKSPTVRRLYGEDLAENQEAQEDHIREASKMVAQWSDQQEFDQALIVHSAITEITTLLNSAVLKSS